MFGLMPAKYKGTCQAYLSFDQFREFVLDFQLLANSLIAAIGPFRQ